VQVLFALVPTPDKPVPGPLIEAIEDYRHILAACLLISCGCFVYSRRHWCDRGEGFRDTMCVPASRPGSRRRVAIFGYRRMLLGLLAITFLMLFGESHVPALASYLFTERWTYTRAPLLTTIAFAFACHAVQFLSAVDSLIRSVDPRSFPDRCQIRHYSDWNWVNGAEARSYQYRTRPTSR
jgi:hypothetical protein